MKSIGTEHGQTNETLSDAKVISREIVWSSIIWPIVAGRYL